MDRATDRVFETESEAIEEAMMRSRAEGISGHIVLHELSCTLWGEDCNCTPVTLVLGAEA
jgi:hypothetical protein